MFGICSILIPAGYSNDPYYYQSPHQPLTNPKETESAYLGPAASSSAAVSPEGDPSREVIAMDATLRDGDFRLFRDLNFTTTTATGSDGVVPVDGNHGETNAVTVIQANGGAIANFEQGRNEAEENPICRNSQNLQYSTKQSQIPHPSCSLWPCKRVLATQHQLFS